MTSQSKCDHGGQDCSHLRKPYCYCLICGVKLTHKHPKPERGYTYSAADAYRAHAGYVPDDEEEPA